MKRLNEILAEEPSNVISKISPRDRVYKSERRPFYFSTGVSALRCIRLVMLAAQKDNPSNILDFACGYGRVLRTLRAAFPKAKLTACDIAPEAVDFCSETFGARPVYGRELADDLEIGDSFDLIWCGSFFTHLNSDRWTEFLELFDSLLEPAGILVFTAHGRSVAAKLRSGNRTFPALTEDLITGMLEDFHCHGFGYRDYPGRQTVRFRRTRGYGISVSAPSWVYSKLEALPRLQSMAYLERGWDRLGPNRDQDVIGCLRSGEQSTKR